MIHPGGQLDMTNLHTVHTQFGAPPKMLPPNNMLRKLEDGKMPGEDKKYKLRGKN